MGRLESLVDLVWRDRLTALEPINEPLQLRVFVHMAAQQGALGARQLGFTPLLLLFGLKLLNQRSPLVNGCGPLACDWSGP